MSPVNNDPSNTAPPGVGMPLTRKEMRARERILASRTHEVPAAHDPAPEVQDVPAMRLPAAPAFEMTAVPETAPGHADEPVAAELPAAELHHQEDLPYLYPHGEDTHHGEGTVDLHGEHDDAWYADNHYDAVSGHDQPAPDGHGYPGHEYADHDAHYGYEHHDDHAALPEAAVSGAGAPSRKVPRRRRMLALFITLGVFVAAIALGAQFLKPLLGMDKPGDYPGPGTGAVTVTVPKGSGPKAIAGILEEKHVVANADTFLRAFLAERGELSPGDFQFRTEMKNSDAVAVLLNKDDSKVIYFALSAGLRVNESLDAISKGSGIPAAQLKALSDAPAQFGVPANARNLEGFLAPGEYRFPLGTAAKDILQKVVTVTLDELKAQGVADPAKQYEIVTVASIVQAEGGQADYGNVAGAVYNRLKPGNEETRGLLQSDAAVTYGLGTRSFNFTQEQRQDASNPYNTYVHLGLPPGPIGSPGRTAIDAAAKPTPNDFLYWVTVNLDTKETKFSRTLAEHNGYVAQYNAWCAANTGRCV